MKNYVKSFIVIIFFMNSINTMTPEQQTKARVIFEVFNTTNEDIGLEYLETPKDRGPFYNLLTIKSGTSQRNPNLGLETINIMTLPRKEQYIRAQITQNVAKVNIRDKQVNLVQYCEQFIRIYGI